MAPVAKKGPKGIFVSRSNVPLCTRNKMPHADPKREPISRDAHAPSTPVNAPINAIKSKSPSPIPCFFVIQVNTLAMDQRNIYPSAAPKILLMGTIGMRSKKLKINPTGMRARVTNREMSIVSKSERMVTMSAENKIKYPQK